MRILDFSDGFQSSTEPTAVPLPSTMVSHTPSGNIESDTVAEAIQELQGDIDTINASVGAPNGIASLDSSGKVLSSQVPAIAIIDVFEVADIAARDALDVETGDVAIVLDNGDGQKQTYMFNGTDWKSIQSDAPLAAHNALTTGVHGVTGHVVGTSDPQTLTNKKIDGGTASSQNRIILPKASKTALDAHSREEASIVYDSVGKKAYIDDGTQLVAIGTGSGSGGINYNTNPNAETDLSGYGTFAQPTLTTGASGTATGTLTRITSGTVRGSTSLQWFPGNLGDGWSRPFTIDPADKSKIIVKSFDYIPTGTIADGDYEIWFYDLTNSKLIPAMNHKFSGVAGSSYTAKAWFQTSSDSVSYRMIVYQKVASTGGYKFVNVQIGPQTIQNATIVTEWTSYTPVGDWTSNTTYAGRWRRVGDSMEVHIVASLTAAPNSSNFNAQIPSGYKIDTSKVNIGSNASFPALGTFMALRSGVNFQSGSVSNIGSETALYAFTSGAGSQVTNTIPVSWGNGDSLSIRAVVPIQGWGATGTVSQSDGRVAATTIAKNADQSIPNNAVTKVTWQASVVDKTGMANISGSRIDIKEAGTFEFTACLTVAANASGYREVLLFKNGSVAYTLGLCPVNSAGTDTRLNGKSPPIDCIVGDYFEIHFYQNCGAALNIIGSYGAGYNYFGVAKLSGSSQVSASESVSSKYSGTPTGTIGTSPGTSGSLTFPTKNFDSGFWNGTTATTPIAGQFQFDGQIQMNATFVANGFAAVSLYIDGVQTSDFIVQTFAGQTVAYIPIADTLNLLANKAITFRASTNGTSPALAGGTLSNRLCIKRTGNY